MIEDDESRFGGSSVVPNFCNFTATDERTRIGLGRALQSGTHDLSSGASCEIVQLPERLLGIDPALDET